MILKNCRSSSIRQRGPQWLIRPANYSLMALFLSLNALADQPPETPADEDNNAIVLDMRAQQPESSQTEPEKPTVVESAALREYRAALAAQEQLHGAYSAELSEHLLGLGLALQKAGLHDEAIKTFRRGAHLQRINQGLYARSQIPMVRSEIDSHFALGNFEEIDSRQQYLFRVERTALKGSPEAIDALMAQAEWQRQAFALDVGESEELANRLMIMWELYRVALNEAIALYGDYNANLLKPLQGMLQTQYLIAGHAIYDDLNEPNEITTRYTTFTSLAFKRGKQVLGAIGELEMLNFGDTPEVRASNLIQLADWHWWFGRRTEATSLYQQALVTLNEPPVTELPNEGEPARTEEKATSEDRVEPVAPDLLATLEEQDWLQVFPRPIPLPDFDGIRPLPAYQLNGNGDLVFKFDVSDSGRVRDLERLREPEVEEGKEEAPWVKNLTRLVKNTRFRPKIVNGEPVPTEDVVISFNRDALLEQSVATLD